MKNDYTEIKHLSHYQMLSAINNGVSFSAHSHNYYEIVLTLEDGFIHTVNSRSHKPKKGEIVILRPGDTHSAQPLEGETCKVRDLYVPVSLFEEICGELNPSLLSDVILRDKSQPPVFTVTESELASLNERLKIPIFTEEHSPKMSYIYPLVIKKAVISEIIGLYCSKQLQKEKYMPECIIKLLNAFQNKQFIELPISEMAYELGYSHNYLCAQFKAYFGISIQKFLINRKMEKAAVMLKDTELSVEAIGKALGWSKTSCFIKNFSAVYSLTPLQYRKQNTGNK